MLQYRTHAAEKSLYNTPPTFGIYVMGEVFKWIQAQGGLAAMAEHNEAKAALLYDFIDQSDFFRGTAQADSRSLMNVCFRAPTEELENKFIAEATKRGLDGLKGHRYAGGMRASIYNACPRRRGRGAGRVHEGVRAGQPGRRQSLTPAETEGRPGAYGSGDPLPYSGASMLRLALAGLCLRAPGPTDPLAAVDPNASPRSWTSPSSRWTGSGGSRARRWSCAATGSSRSGPANRVKVPDGRRCGWTAGASS